MNIETATSVSATNPADIEMQSNSRPTVFLDDDDDDDDDLLDYGRHKLN